MKHVVVGFLALLTAASSKSTAQSWQDITPNVPGLINMGNIGPMTTDGTRLYVLGRSGVFVSADHGDSWTALNAVAGGSYTLADAGLRFVKFENGLVWVGGAPGSAEVTKGVNTLHRLAPGDTTWQKAALSGFPGSVFSSSTEDIAFDASAGVYYAASALGGVYRSTDGLNWAHNRAGLPTGFLSVTVGDTVVATNGQALLSITGGGVWKTTDGTNWVATPGPVGQPGNLLHYQNRVLYPVSGATLLNDGVYISGDLGATWTQYTGIGGPYDLTTDGNLIYAALGPGLYFSATAGITWDPIPSAGLPAGLAINRVLRQGDYLFAVGRVGNATNGTLARLNVAAYPFKPSPQIAKQPVSSPVLLEGSAYTFKVEAGGRNLTYQWQKDGVGIPGATAASLVFNSITVADKGSYQVVVSDGTTNVTSAVASLNVFARIEGRADLRFVSTAPSILTEVNVVVDDFTTIQAQANSVFKYGTDGKLLTSRTFDTGIRYDGLIRDQAGRVVIAGNGLRRLDPITLQDDPSFTTVVTNLVFGQPAEWPGHGYLVPAAGSVILLYRYDGARDLSFTHSLGSLESALLHVYVSADGTIYRRSDTFGLARLRPNGDLDPTLALPNFGINALFFFQPLRDGRLLVARQAPSGTAFQFQAYFPDGTRNTGFNVADARVNGAISCVAEQADGKLLVAGKFTAYGSATVAGIMRLNRDGTRDTSFYDATSFGGSGVSWVSYDPHGYAFLSPGFGSNGFQDTGHNGLARVFASPAALTIFSQSPSQKVPLDGAITLHVNAVGTSPLAYQWFKDGIAISQATGPELTVTNFQVTDGGSYTVQVTNASGAVTSGPTVLAAIGAPTILIAPSGGDVILGTNFTLNVMADGAGTLAYQWKKNGQPVVGAVSTQLALKNLSLNDTAAYTVVVTNAFGSVESAPAVVTVHVVTGGLVEGFAGAGLSNVRRLAVMPDKSAVFIGSFTTVSNQVHPWFTRLDTNGAPVTGWFETARGGITGIEAANVKVLASGKVVISGQYSQISGVARSGLARLNGDGTVDSTFVPVGSPSGTIQALDELPNGQLLVGGTFSTWGAVQAPYLARVNLDGSVDTSFGTGANNWVNVIKARRDGTAYVAGSFTKLAGQGRQYVARLLPDGSLDATFVPPSINGPPTDLAIDLQGRVLISGPFTSVGGLSRNFLARLNSDGSVDASFDPGTAVTAPGPIQVQLNGKILVGGNSLLRLFPDGRRDPNFVLPAGITSISSFVATPDGWLYIGGGFTSLGGEARNHVAVITTEQADLAITAQPQSVAADLGATASFTTIVYTTSTATYQWFHNTAPIPGATNAVLQLANLSRGDAGDYQVILTNASGSQSSDLAHLVVRAEPTLLSQPQTQAVPQGAQVNFGIEVQGAAPLTFQWRKNGQDLAGATNRNLSIAGATLADAGVYDVLVNNALGTVRSFPAGLGVFAATGAIDASFNPGSGANDTVWAIAQFPNGNFAIGGNFTTFAGQPRLRFAVLDPNGALMSLTNNIPINGPVYAIVVQADGKFVTGSSANLLRWNADGSLDNTFTGVVGSVTELNIVGSGLLVGGWFNSNFTPGLRRWDLGTGKEDTAFLSKSSATTTGWAVTAVHPLADGRMLVGNNVGQLARLNAEGSADSSFKPAVANAGALNAIVLTADGKIWIGGSFLQFGGQAHSYVVRLNADGSLDTPVLAGMNAQVNVLIGSGNDVLAGGDFNPLVNNRTYAGLARLSGLTGQLDPAFGPTFTNAQVKGLLALPNGKLMAVGSFNSPGRIARVNTQFNGTLVVDGGPTSQNANPGDTIVLTTGWSGGSAAAFQWSKNGQALAGATNQALVITNALATDAGSYTITVATSDGTQTSAPATVTVGPGQTTVGFTDWKARFQFPPNQDGPSADPDNDGLPNIVEFAFGTNPLDPASRNLPAASRVIDNGKNYPAVTFIHNKSAAGVTILVRVSSTIQFTDDLGSSQSSVTDLGDGTEQITIRSNAPDSVHPVQFMRIQVTAPF